MSVNEVALMYDLLEKKGACNIVELGRNYGTSTRLFLQHVVRHGGYLESWDLKHWGNLKDTFTFQGFHVSPYADYAEHEQSYQIGDNKDIFSRILIADSIMTPIIPQKRWVDFLLIDTEHSIANALYEYGRWRQYLRSGAMVAFHDSTLPGVVRAIELIKEIELAECGERFVREPVNEREDGYRIKILEGRG